MLLHTREPSPPNAMHVSKGQFMLLFLTLYFSASWRRPSTRSYLEVSEQPGPCVHVGPHSENGGLQEEDKHPPHPQGAGVFG